MRQGETSAAQSGGFRLTLAGVVLVSLVATACTSEASPPSEAPPTAPPPIATTSPATNTTTPPVPSTTPQPLPEPTQIIALDFIEWVIAVESDDARFGLLLFGEVPRRGTREPGGPHGRTTVGPLAMRTASDLVLDVPPLTPGGNSCLRRISKVGTRYPDKVRRCGIVGAYAEDGTVAWFEVVADAVVFPDEPLPMVGYRPLVDIREGRALLSNGWLLPIADEVDVCGTPIRHGGSWDALEEALPEGWSGMCMTRASIDLSRHQVTTIGCAYNL